MLIGGIVAALVVVALAAMLLTRRRSHDDVHSVEGYHRSLHTLETINTHPAVAGSEPSVLAGQSNRSDSASHQNRTHTVRVTDLPAAVPPVPPPLGPDLSSRLTFDDDRPSEVLPPHGVGPRDKAMVSINHRPRRLAAPAMAVAAVLALIVVLLVTGSHTVAPTARHNTASSQGKAGKAGRSGQATATTTSTTTTQIPVVSLPQTSTSQHATYDVAPAAFTLNLVATSGSCWIEATNTQTGVVLFAGVLGPGEQHSITAASPLSVEVGAPTVFRASVNGAAVALPPGFQTPFTMDFVALGA